MTLNRTFLLTAIIAFVLLFFTSGCTSQDPAAEEDREVSVETALVETRDILHVTRISGRAAAEQDVLVLPKVGGRVERVVVETGQRVNKKDALFYLERDEIGAQLRQAQASLAAAEAARAQALSQHENAKVELDRMRRLYEEGAVSRQQLEQAQLQYELTRPESAEAQYRQAAAALEAVQYQYDNTVITSPISGIVNSLELEVGDMAGPNSPAARIVKIDAVNVEFSVTEGQVNKIAVGQEADVLIASASREPFQGKIVSISTASDPQTRLYPVKIRIANYDNIIKPGMFAEVELILSRKADAVSVPVGSVFVRNGEEGVFLVENGKAVFRKVESGIDDGEYLEIIEGLEPGEELVVTGQNLITENTSVKVVERGEN